jgi:ABC-type multidrug transport system fused ATPase/permease subunit
MIKTLRIFYKFVTEKKLAFAGFILLVIISTILSNLTPYFYKLFIDAIPSSNFHSLFIILCIYIAVRIASLLFDVSSMWVGDFNLINAVAKARSYIFKYVQDLDFAFHSSKSTGALISAFKRGDGAFFNFFDTIHHRILGTVVSLAVMLYFFSAIDIKITLAACLSIILTLIATRFLIKNNLSKRIRFNAEEDNISAVITDNLINYET